MIIKIVIGILVLVAVYNLFQNKHSLLRSFPLIGYFRYFFETIGPEMRQYIVAGNREELPFTRVQREWVVESAKGGNNMTGFGSDADFSKEGFIFFDPAMLQRKMKQIDARPLKTIGTRRRHPYRPSSFVNISGMSYGALSPEAVTALNKGALIAGCYQNTGEGGFSPYHDNGAEVCFQIGTAYYGCRDEEGNFSIAKLVELVTNHPCIKMIEIKLSQGAKAGKGGILPKEKVDDAIAASRGIKKGQDSVSPAYHSAFGMDAEDDKQLVQAMVDFIEMISEKTGLPVGIKSAVGDLECWYILADIMRNTGQGPDFITIDGGEGGTGAAPATFADHVALPFFEGFALVYKIFKDYNMTNQVTWIGSGKLGLPSRAVKAFSMGVDIVHIARTALLSIGCIQAQKCHTNRCPRGLTTQLWWFRRSLNPTLKSRRFANYHKQFVKLIMDVTHACGHIHPSYIPMTQVKMRKHGKLVDINEYYGYSRPVNKHQEAELVN